MRTRAWYLGLFAFWMVIVSLCGSCKARSQSIPTDAPEIQTFPEPDPQVDREAVSERKAIHRATIVIDKTMSVEVLEKPKSEINFDSVVVVRKAGRESHTFDVGHMIGHRQLRLVHAALLRADDNSGMLVLEFEGGAVGAREGFAVLRYSPGLFQLHVLPLTDYGKVVVFRARPDSAEVWSGDCASISSDAGGCEYQRRICNWGDNGYTCSAPKEIKGLFNKGDISDPGIEVK